MATPLRDPAYEPASLRRSGIERVGDLPWGAHICLFYETSADLLDIAADYFRAGLEDNEFCIWALSEPLTHEEAADSLREAIPGFDTYLARGAIELVSGYDWYLKGDEFDSQRITRGWHRKLVEAKARGHAGMRVSGNAFWMESSLWKDFCAYEGELDHSLSGHEMIVLCTYSLLASRTVDLLDVVRAHNFSLARRRGRWEFLETPELAQARRHIGQLNSAINILSNPFPGRESLTPRERVTLAQIVMGASSKEAARNLKISHRTVEFHRANILRKLEVKNTAELIHKVLSAKTRR
jgi:DNA-binding CsgD family transcriptional regulator